MLAKRATGWDRILLEIFLRATLAPLEYIKVIDGEKEVLVDQSLSSTPGCRRFASTINDDTPQILETAGFDPGQWPGNDLFFAGQLRAHIHFNISRHAGLNNSNTPFLISMFTLEYTIDPGLVHISIQDRRNCVARLRAQRFEWTLRRTYHISCGARCPTLA
ncbi:hypothetical protein M427DRAFT_338132 [Gonapodya prolifera JEL478]|uniref:Uncharacterized protein n=1 Tax=Gonapodya prolifera (strain JEL478) TaxID=1344416 RepID=A0A139ACG1_GONPJ|nr:hypothetical protein M427DRAFT_338132 [Gonapodya prolifera JEL478]|eukprot:KXS14502.1 hypothetical protein M427DRAFT_338132 [Gonapodya prolifera JEL478]